MESEARYALVGTVVLLLLGGLVAAILWLRGAGAERDANRYKVYFERQSLDGLQLRSDVKMRGIVVGSVESFRISPAKRGAVEVVIRVDEQAPVRESTRAVVERQLVTGLASINLLTADEKAPLLVQVPAGEAYPVIAEGESDFAQFSQSVTQLAQKAGETLSRVNDLLTAENRATVMRTVETLDRTLVSLERLAVNAERELRGFNAALASVNRAGAQLASLGAELERQAGTLAARYDELGKESAAAAYEVRVSVAGMAADVQRLAARAEVMVARTGNEVAGTAQEVRSAARSLGSAARGFRNPRTILVGPAPGDLGPGEGR